MTHWQINGQQRDPKFNDDFERKMANDITYHLARKEPSFCGSLVRRLGQRLFGISRLAQTSHTTDG